MSVRGSYHISDCMALLDGGSIYLELIDGEGHKEQVKLDKEIGSPTEGKVFASMLNKDRPLSEEEEQILLEILLYAHADTENHAWHLKMVTDYLHGIAPQSGDALSQRDIDELLDGS